MAPTTVQWSVGAGDALQKQHWNQQKSSQSTVQSSDNNLIYFSGKFLLYDWFMQFFLQEWTQPGLPVLTDPLWVF